MKRIQSAIKERQMKFGKHLFFQKLEKANSPVTAMFFTKDLTFWVTTFQDILRLNDQKVEDPLLKKVTRHHRLEDAGHDKWFFDDLRYLFPNQDIEVEWLFSKSHARTRDATHALMSEVFRASDDRIRVALLLVLESSGHIFFEKIANYAEAMGLTPHLKYFSKNHLEVEKEHAIFEKELERLIFSLELPSDLYAEALAMIERAYAAFESMFDGLTGHLDA